MSSASSCGSSNAAKCPPRVPAREFVLPFQVRRLDPPLGKGLQKEQKEKREGEGPRNLPQVYTRAGSYGSAASAARANESAVRSVGSAAPPAPTRPLPHPRGEGREGGKAA